MDSERISGLPARVAPYDRCRDAFAAGFIAATLHGEGGGSANRLEAACQAGDAAGTQTVGKFGAVTAWL